jgi:hypothetical protein
MDTAALFTNLQNFQESPGTVTGVLKAEAGLSGAIFVTVCCHPSTPGLWWFSYVFLEAEGSLNQ